MQAVRDAWGRTGHQNIFSDDYGILKLAADATLTKTPTPLKWVDFQWGEWRKRFLAAIKQLWPINTITPSEFIWLESDIYTYKIIDEPYTKPAKKFSMSFNRKGKKMHHKKVLKNV